MHDLGILPVSRALRLRWKEGKVAAEWARRYPELFDTDDVRLVQSQGHMGYHFIECFAAIILHHVTGYHALVAKYQFKPHRRKQEIIAKLFSPQMLKVLLDRRTDSAAQPPDLVMYAPDHSAYFFCEVKGPGDRVSLAQESKFNALAAVDGAQVFLLRFRWADSNSDLPFSTPKDITQILQGRNVTTRHRPNCESPS